MVGLSQLQQSRRKILENLLDDDLTPIQLNEKMRIKISTIRNHLDKLEKDGYIEHYFERADKGRPKKKYTLTSKTQKALPRKYDFVLSQLLIELESEFDEETIKHILASISKNITDLDDDFLDKGLDTRLDRVVDFRSELDLYPSLIEENGSYLLQHKNCGCLELDKKIHKYICYLCRQVISNFVPDCEVEQVKSFATEDDICVHRITQK